MNTVSRARIARKRAQRLGLRLSQSGTVFTVRDDNDVTLAVGPLGVVDRYLIDRIRPKPPGPQPTTRAPEAWQRCVDDYLLTLAAAGQRPATIRLRKGILCLAARGLGCPPAEVTADELVNWFGRQQHWSSEARHSYRSTLRGFFVWMYETDRVPVYIADALPKVRVPKAPPRPASDQAWVAALERADQRTELMLRLAAEAGLRRGEIAQLHANDLIDVPGTRRLLVRGKGGKERMVPVSDYVAALIRECGDGWAFPSPGRDHLTAAHVGKIIARALPDNWTAHTLRHRYATRVYRGSRNIRAVQQLLGHESILTTERYVAVCDEEIQEAASCAW
ncbi:tyrosine-type recombinase/integrase [Mycobacterium sherrisii]|uniref:tyrosine-type recombinase/integrase n=1 Tax=Mycobacterium sherrisii TaxID=243061 RepID=UPI003974BAA4